MIILMLPAVEDGPAVVKKPLRIDRDHPDSHYGQGVLVTEFGDEQIDGQRFRWLRDYRDAWIEAADPKAVARALGVPWQDDFREPGIVMSSAHVAERRP